MSKDSRTDRFTKLIKETFHNRNTSYWTYREVIEHYYAEDASLEGPFFVLLGRNLLILFYFLWCSGNRDISVDVKEVTFSEDNKSAFAVSTVHFAPRLLPFYHINFDLILQFTLDPKTGLIKSQKAIWNIIQVLKMLPFFAYFYDIFFNLAGRFVTFYFNILLNNSHATKTA